MDKRDCISLVLDKLSAYRPMAKGLKVLLNQDKLDDKTIQGLIAVFEQSIKEATDKKQKDKLQSSLDIIKKIHSQEDQDRLEIDKDLDQMLKNI
ncbi:hypothetical protein K9M48_04455 [Candidatus Gracilibacteria bacterium]|nr:hypothetical protein [Candidatus Gracilibacteria bacterium]